MSLAAVAAQYRSLPQDLGTLKTLLQMVNEHASIHARTLSGVQTRYTEYAVVDSRGDVGLGPSLKNVVGLALPLHDPNAN